MNAASQAALAQLGTLIAQRLPATATPSDISTLMSSFSTVAQPLGTDNTLPSVVGVDANALNTAAGEVAALIAANPADTVPSIMASSAFVAVVPAAQALLVSALAASVLADVTTNLCMGYSSRGVSLFQGAAGLSTATVGQYDSVTAAALQTILGGSTPAPTIPPACPAGSGGGTITPTPIGPTPTPAPVPGTTTTTITTTTTPMSTAAVVGITLGSVVAIGALGYLLMKAKPATALAVGAKRKSNPMGRREVDAWAKEYKKTLDPETAQLIEWANWDLYYGPSGGGLDEGYPGFTTATRKIRSSLRDVSDLYIDDWSGIAETSPPEDPGEPYAVVDRKDVIKAIVGRELAPYVS